MNVKVTLVFLLVAHISWAEIAPVDPEVENLQHKVSEENELVDQQVPKVDKEKEPTGFMGASGSFVHGAIATLSVIVVSELGDKTFFIAAIMAMRHPRLIVFTGAMSALALMHTMSAFFGYVFTIIPRMFTYYVSSFLFAIFGLKMLREGWKMSPNVSDVILYFPIIHLYIFLIISRRLRRS